MEKIRIAQMIDRPALGGGQTALLLLAENLDRRLFEIFVCSGGDGPLVDEVRSRGLTHIPVPLSKTFRPSSVKEIARVLERNGIQILHTHGGIAGFYGRWAARRSGTPVIIHTLHGIHYLHYRNPLLRDLYVIQERTFSRFTDALILVSRADLSQAKKHRLGPEDKMFIIPNGTELKPERDDADRQRKRRGLGWEAEDPVIGTVARLHRQKGVSYLVQAAERILRDFPRGKIVLVGEGPLGQKLRKSAVKTGLEGRVLFLGERKDAVELMSLFDIFVLPSLWEGLPFVLVEAATLGIPIVATAVDGVTEIIEDGKTGLLVPPKDGQALADAIIRLLRDKPSALRLAVRAKALIPARFPLRRMVDQTQNLYLKLYQRQSN
jgi:glycosyltransferase involved in cell wall biosynthesis